MVCCSAAASSDDLRSVINSNQSPKVNTCMIEAKSTEHVNCQAWSCPRSASLAWASEQNYHQRSPLSGHVMKNLLLSNSVCTAAIFWLTANQPHLTEATASSCCALLNPQCMSTESRSALALESASTAARERSEAVMTHGNSRHDNYTACA